jgi:uncharacterized protein with PIN domain
MTSESEVEKKRCAECDSLNVKAIGAGHVTGVGEPMRDVDKFQYECYDCGHIFWLTIES